MTSRAWLVWQTFTIGSSIIGRKLIVYCTEDFIICMSIGISPFSLCQIYDRLTNRSGRLQQISRLQAVSVSILADSVDLLSTKQKAFPSPKSRATSYPFHRIAKLMMNRSHKLIEQYDRMSQHILSYDKPPGFDSEQNEDCRKLNDLIDAHGNKSKQLVRNLLGVDNPLNKSGSNDTSWSKDMWKCYAVDESRDKSPTRRVERKNWAKLAKLAEGDVRLLMTHFKEVDIIT